ncbi:MAG TPA: glycerol-3-phosphate 1-O-acyltransferase PlsY [Methylomirabilota bacterium]|nr:glycerol-3-phosphate 1-O-acyltransferase PlsY [Methylomirabilota bacterium]
MQTLGVQILLGLLGLTVVYLIGAIPIGLLVSRCFRIDIRRHGSGNIGATNVFRTLGKGPGILTFLGDVAKGWAGVWLAQHLGTESSWGAAGALLVIVGHCWSVFLRFQGGKGVATGFGAFLRLAPWAVLPAALVWIAVAASFRYVSLASVVAALCLPAGAFLLGYPTPVLVVSMIVALIVIARHKENLTRLFEGTERKVGSRVSA